MFGGGVGTVTYKALAGLANGGIAWREVAMRPLPAAIERLGSANASVTTPHGPAAISWRRLCDALLPKVAVSCFISIRKVEALG